MALSVVAVATTLGGAMATEHEASAAFFEAGGEAGVLQRSLADTRYKPDFAWQVHAEIAFIPSILMVGPYFGMNTGTPEVLNKDGTSQKPVDFRTLGARAKVRLPLGGPVVPYGLIGIGWVHGNFPDQMVQLCSTLPAPIGYQCDPTPRQVPNATANFVEIPVGVGLAFQLADEVALTIEGDWRPTVGYKNDVYEVAAKNAQTTGSTQPPPPGRNGWAFSGMAGLAITL
jgi:opacity protein-like surface antigen